MLISSFYPFNLVGYPATLGRQVVHQACLEVVIKGLLDHRHMGGTGNDLQHGALGQAVRAEIYRIIVQIWILVTTGHLHRHGNGAQVDQLLRGAHAQVAPLSFYIEAAHLFSCGD